MTERISNRSIYDLAINQELPVRLVCKLSGLKRQRVHVILDNMIAKYGGKKPVLCVPLAPVYIDRQIQKIIEGETARLGISSSALVRIAINQAIKNNLKFELETEVKTYVHRTPSTKITNSQHTFLCKSSHISKSAKIRQILKSYKSLNLQEVIR